MQLLGRHQRKATRQIKAHLVAENRQRAGSGAVILPDAMLAHMAHEIEILLMAELADY